MAALFVLTMLMGGVDAYAALPLLHGPLADIYQHRGTVMLGGLMRLLMAIGVVGIALAFLPVGRRHNETLSFAYLSFRIAECVLLALGACAHVFLIRFSHDLAQAGPHTSETFAILATASLEFTQVTYQMAMTILGISGVLHCGLMYQVQLVPRAISALGLVGYLLLFASAPLDLADVVDTRDGMGALMYVPGGLFELVVLPVWLVWKGFRPS